MKAFAPVPFGSDSSARPGSAVTGSPATDACLRALERVEAVLDQETSALRNRQPIDLADLNRRKSHGLLELTRAARSVEPGAAAPLAPGLRRLKAKLVENSGLLKTHLDAVKEVAAVMARAIRDGESDGTYSAAIRFPGYGA